MNPDAEENNNISPPSGGTSEALVSTDTVDISGESGGYEEDQIDASTVKEKLSTTPPTGWRRLGQRVVSGLTKNRVRQPSTASLDPLPNAVEEVRIAAPTLTVEVARWNKRRDIPLTILAWVGVAYVTLLVAQHIITTLLLLVLSAVLAFALAPAVFFLQRWVPRFLAILLVYLLMLGVLGVLVYFIISSAIDQVHSLSIYITQQKWTALFDLLKPFGIRQSQVQSAFQGLQGQLLSQANSAATSVVPFLKSFFDAILNIVLVVVLSIYFLVDGGRILLWLRRGAPRSIRGQTHLTLDTIDRVVGGYIRGQLLLCGLIGVLVGVGMTILHVPYALLLGVLAFILEFIPILGTLTSGAICVLLALTQGPLIAVIVLAYFVGIHVLEGDVIGPRIVGKAIGLHPIVSIAALIAGSELFGIWGALFASPIAGVVQALIIAIWFEWRKQHPLEFQSPKNQALNGLADQLIEQSPVSGDATVPKTTE